MPRIVPQSKSTVEAQPHSQPSHHTRSTCTAYFCGPAGRAAAVTPDDVRAHAPTWPTNVGAPVGRLGERANTVVPAAAGERLRPADGMRDRDGTPTSAPDGERPAAEAWAASAARPGLLGTRGNAGTLASGVGARGLVRVGWGFGTAAGTLGGVTFGAGGTEGLSAVGRRAGDAAPWPGPPRPTPRRRRGEREVARTSSRRGTYVKPVNSASMLGLMLISTGVSTTARSVNRESKLLTSVSERCTSANEQTNKYTEHKKYDDNKHHTDNSPCGAQ